MCLITKDERFGKLVALTKWVTENRDRPHSHKVHCYKHQLVAALEISDRQDRDPRLVCSQCFWDIFPEVGQPERHLQPMGRIEKCHNESCCAHVEVNSQSRCVFCAEIFCPAHGNREHYTCDKCAEEVTAEIARRP